MLYNGFRSYTIIVRKIKPVAISYSFNIPITLLSNSDSQTILKTEFIKRDFHKNASNYNVPYYLSKEEIDMRDNETLNKLLEDSKNEKVFNLLKYELEYLKQLNEAVPQNIRPKDWIYLLKAPTKSQQRKYLRFLFINEKKCFNDKERKQLLIEQNRKQWAEKQESFTSGLTYGLGKNSIFMRIYDKTMDNFLNYHVALSMLFEPKVVFDCGYDNHMTRCEADNCAKQLLISFVLNRQHRIPSHLYLCNASQDGKVMKQLHNLLPSLYEDSFPLDCTPNSYLDLFDKEKLVYLTPHCRKTMTSYDPDKIYIIGALVDKTDPKPYSLAKAKREGICMEKFPLDKYLRWSSGSGKSLTLNQVLAVLLDMKVLNDWPSVFEKHIPTRKLFRKTENTSINVKY